MTKKYTHASARNLIRSKLYEARHYDYDDRFTYIDIDGLEKQGKKTIAIVEVKYFGEQLTSYQIQALIYTADCEFVPPRPVFIVYHNHDLSKVYAKALNAAAHEYGDADTEKDWLNILYKLRGLTPDESVLESVEKTHNTFLAWYRSKLRKESMPEINNYVRETPLEEILKKKAQLGCAAC